MILNKHSNKFQEGKPESYITQQKLLSILSNQPEFRNDLQKVFQIKEDDTKIIKIGNSKELIDSLEVLSSQCEKIDICSKVNNVQLKKMLKDEKSIFEIYEIKDDFILRKNKSDILETQTAYSAKNDLLDIYSLNKFANYCRDMEYDDLIEKIKEYLKEKNIDNKDEKNLRLVYKYDDNKFYLRALTSTNNYKNFGINFSILLLLLF